MYILTYYQEAFQNFRKVKKLSFTLDFIKSRSKIF